MRYVIKISRSHSKRLSVFIDKDLHDRLERIMQDRYPAVRLRMALVKQVGHAFKFVLSTQGNAFTYASKSETQFAYRSAFTIPFKPFGITAIEAEVNAEGEMEFTIPSELPKPMKPYKKSSKAEPEKKEPDPHEQYGRVENKVIPDSLNYFNTVRKELFKQMKLHHIKLKVGEDLLSPDDLKFVVMQPVEI